MTSRADRYMARVDQHLWWLHDDAERFDFITEQMAVWEERRDAFIRKVDGGGDPGTTTIWDFTETLQALEILQAKYSPTKQVREELSASANEMRERVEHLENELSA